MTEILAPTNRARALAARKDAPVRHIHGIRRCREITCLRRFTPTQIKQDFCSPQCRHQWWVRAQTRAGTAYKLLLDWRLKRREKGATRGVLTDISRIVDDWIREDNEAKRLLKIETEKDEARK